MFFGKNKITCKASGSIMKAGSIATAGSFLQTAAGNQAYHDDQGKFEI